MSVSLRVSLSIRSVNLIVIVGMTGSSSMGLSPSMIVSESMGVIVWV